VAPGDYVRLSVADTGVGMTPEVLARACDPFFTTKEVGKGSGLGLAQVYGVARQSGGALRIESTVGQGTVVEVYLPRSFGRPAAAAERRACPSAGVVPGGATVLVVDDHEDVREVATAQLEALGYQVVQAASGKVALDLLGSGNGIDLLMVDYAMPEMSGIDLARAVQRKCPDMPVLIVTGYADTALVHGQIPLARIMKKPYRMTELAEAIENLLRRRSGDRPSGNVVALRAAEK
jgi:CheY-like chemotaxis protein